MKLGKVREVYALNLSPPHSPRQTFLLAMFYWNIPIRSTWRKFPY